MIPIIEQSKKHAGHTAIIDCDGSYTYSQLYLQAMQVAGAIAALRGTSPGPVLFLIPSGYPYVAVQWGIWLAGGTAVPIHTGHPAEEIAYIRKDSGAGLLIHSATFSEKINTITDDGLLTITAEDLFRENAAAPLPDPDGTAAAMIIYTSGTTGSPKGVVISHHQLQAQIMSLSEAWAWSEGDRILNVLPMHHVHGVINITCCALYNGAICEMQAGFDPAYATQRMASGELSLFMAVPTIYHKLIRHFESLPEKEQQSWQKGMKQMRLMVSGSAALPVTVLEKWEAISGHTLLERYGMTEIGMALSNPLHGERKPGYVGKPLPGVAVKLTDEIQEAVITPFVPGELYVKGDTVFQYYWNRPEETKKSFDDGWFRTGDIAEFDTDGDYRILGRNSSDIIKSGGYKISALEIEHVLLEHPSVNECAIVALPDEEWGELIAAAITGDADPELLKEWLKGKLAPYKLPRKWISIDTLPRNAMGKILKNEVRKFFPGK
jgi:malonyl-CoA/methylmalonyl-CoA synthetase